MMMWKALLWLTFITLVLLDGAKSQWVTDPSRILSFVIQEEDAFVTVEAQGSLISLPPSAVPVRPSVAVATFTGLGVGRDTTSSIIEEEDEENSPQAVVLEETIGLVNNGQILTLYNFTSETPPVVFAADFSCIEPSASSTALGVFTGSLSHSFGFDVEGSSLIFLVSDTYVDGTPVTTSDPLTIPSETLASLQLVPGATCFFEYDSNNDGLLDVRLQFVAMAAPTMAPTDRPSTSYEPTEIAGIQTPPPSVSSSPTEIAGIQTPAPSCASSSTKSSKSPSSSSGKGTSKGSHSTKSPMKSCDTTTTKKKKSSKKSPA